MACGQNTNQLHMQANRLNRTTRESNNQTTKNRGRMEQTNIQQPPLDLTRVLRALGYTHPSDLDGASVIAIRSNGEIVHDYLQGVTNAHAQVIVWRLRNTRERIMESTRTASAWQTTLDSKWKTINILEK